MKTDQQFWEDIVTALAPVIIEQVLTSEKLVDFLAGNNQHASTFAAELAARTADELLVRRETRLGGIGRVVEAPAGESVATS